MTLAEFASVCRENGIQLDAGQLRCFARYAESLAEWNAKVNLVSRRDVEHVWERHMLHSVTMLVHASIPRGARVADIGTGGGFPGIPLKICRPDLNIVLIDSVQKKMVALEGILNDVRACDARMADVRGVCGRAEDLATLPAFHHAFDMVTARAVAPLTDLVRWATQLLKPKGRLLALKGGTLNDEISSVHGAHRGLRIKRTTLTLHGMPEYEHDAKQLIEVQW